MRQHMDSLCPAAGEKPRRHPWPSVHHQCRLYVKARQSTLEKSILGHQVFTNAMQPLATHWKTFTNYFYIHCILTYNRHY